MVVSFYTTLGGEWQGLPVHISATVENGDILDWTAEVELAGGKTHDITRAIGTIESRETERKILEYYKNEGAVPGKIMNNVALAIAQINNARQCLVVVPNAQREEIEMRTKRADNLLIEAVSLLKEKAR